MKRSAPQDPAAHIKPVLAAPLEATHMVGGTGFVNAVGLR